MRGRRFRLKVAAAVRRANDGASTPRQRHWLRQSTARKGLEQTLPSDSLRHRPVESDFFPLPTRPAVYGVRACPIGDSKYLISLSSKNPVLPNANTMARLHAHMSSLAVCRLPSSLFYVAFGARKALSNEASHGTRQHNRYPNIYPIMFSRT